MAAMLASHSCYCRRGELINHESNGTILFSSKFDRQSGTTRRRIHRLKVQMQQTESPAKVGINGRPVKMVPTSEVTKRKAPSINGAETVNGSTRRINGASIVKRVPTPSPLKIQKSKELPPTEDLKVLPSDEGFSWANENYNSVQRSIDVWSFVLSLRARVFLDNAKWTYAGGFTEDKQKIRRRGTASWLRERVLQLGPTFIKLGQLSSTRSDLFPREFVDELAKLQDRVPAFSPKKAKEFIKKELGVPVDLLYKEFEDQPIAAASLGQVHRAVLYNGEKVVIKVQRPGLKKLFDIDLKNLKLIAEYFQKSETLGGPTRDWMGIYEECAKILYEEIDYINEGKNADRFRRDFRNIKWVRVPLVYWDYTATKVLTLEYVPGIKINKLDLIDAQGFSRSRIASRAIEAYLIQILKTGFFHADPHPGNLAIDDDEALIYYDFGMMGDIKSFTRERLLGLFYAVYEKDAKKISLMSEKSNAMSEKSNDMSEKSNAKWDDYSQLVFVELCEDEIRKGNRPNTSLSRDGWKNLVKEFNKRTGKKYDRQKMRNHWNVMKSEWSLFKQLRNGETGLGWDDTNKTIVADDEWWEQKIKENKGYKKFKDKDLSLIWFRYDALFADIVATGERARSATQEQMTDLGLDPQDEEENDFEDHLSDNSEGTPNVNPIMFPTPSINRKRSIDGIGTSSQSKSKKIKSGGASALREDIHSLLEMMSSKVSASFSSTATTEDTTEKCIDMLSCIPSIPTSSDIYHYVVNMFMKKEFRNAFLSLPTDEARKHWLEYNYQKSFK